MKLPATNPPSNFFSWNGEYTRKYLQPGIERSYLSHGGEACVAVLAPLRLPDAEVLLRCRGCAEIMTSLALVALIKRSTTGKTMSMLHTKLKIDKLFTFLRPNHRLGTGSLALDEEYGMKSILEEQGTFLADYGVKVILQGNIMSSTSRYFRFHILILVRSLFP